MVPYAVSSTDTIHIFPYRNDSVTQPCTLCILLTLLAPLPSWYIEHGIYIAISRLSTSERGGEHPAGGLDNTC